MTDPYRELGEFFARLAALDRDRAELSEAIAQRMNALSGGAGEAVRVPANAPGAKSPAAKPAAPSPFPRSLRERIHRVISEASGPVSSWDIAEKLGVHDGHNLRLIRGTLARMAKQRLIRRVAFGRYGVS
jgi:hypothetical protein